MPAQPSGQSMGQMAAGQLQGMQRQPLPQQAAQVADQVSAMPAGNPQMIGGAMGAAANDMQRMPSPGQKLPGGFAQGIAQGFGQMQGRPDAFQQFEQFAQKPIGAPQGDMQAFGAPQMQTMQQPWGSPKMPIAAGQALAQYAGQQPDPMQMQAQQMAFAQQAPQQMQQMAQGQQMQDMRSMLQAKMGGFGQRPIPR